MMINRMNATAASVIFVLWAGCGLLISAYGAQKSPEVETDRAGSGITPIAKQISSAQAERTVVCMEAGSLPVAEDVARKLGSVQKLDTLPDYENSVDTVIVVGRLGDSHIASLIKTLGLKFDANWIGDEGFYIKSFDSGRGRRILITANSRAGIYYGLYELEKRVFYEGKDILRQPFDLKDRPFFPCRIIGGTRGRGNVAWSQSNEFSHANNQPFYYRDTPELFPDEATREKHYRTVTKYRKALKERIKQAHDKGAKFYLFLFLPSLPLSGLDGNWAVPTLFKAHPELKPMRKDSIWRPFMCPSQEISKKIMYSKIKELFCDCELDGLILNIGEHNKTLSSCGCDKCAMQSYEDRLIEYLNLMLKAMKEGNPKARILLRSWGIITKDKERGISAEAFAKLPDKLPEDVCFIGRLTSPPMVDEAWQNCYTPFLKMKRFMPWRWVGYHPDTNRGYFMNQLLYDAPKYKARAMELGDMGLKGLVKSSDGRGCEDPLRELCYSAWGEIGWDPYKFDPEEYLCRWAKKRFGPKAEPYVTAALKDSWKVIDSFLFYERLTQTCHIMNFVPTRNCNFYNRSCVSRQLEAVRDVTTATLPDLLKRFDISESVRIAQEAEANLDKAHEICPDNKWLDVLWKLGKATEGLARFWRGHHLSIIYNNLAERSDCKKKEEYLELAKKYSRESLSGAKKYAYWLYEAYPMLNDAFDMNEGVVKWSGGFASFTGPMIPYPIYYIHARLSSVVHQAQNGYNRIVMDEIRRTRYPYLLWAAKNKDEKIHFSPKVRNKQAMRWSNLLPTLKKKYGRKEFVLDLDKDKADALPALLSPAIMPTLKVRFKGDLAKGAMLAVKHRPLGGGDNPRDAEIDIFLDGKKAGTIRDLTNAETLQYAYDFIRLVELPASTQEEHELVLTTPRSTGAELYFLRLYTPSKQNRYLEQGGDVDPFDRPPRRKAIRLEAEKFSALKNVVMVDNDGASCRKLVRLSNPDSGIETEVELDAGTYTVVVGGLALNSDEDGFTCRIADQSWPLCFDTHGTLTSAYVNVKIPRKGKHKIFIGSREPNVEIDFVELR